MNNNKLFQFINYRPIFNMKAVNIFILTFFSVLLNATFIIIYLVFNFRGCTIYLK